MRNNTAAQNLLMKSRTSRVVSFFPRKVFFSRSNNNFRLILLLLFICVWLLILDFKFHFFIPHLTIVMRHYYFPFCRSAYWFHVIELLINSIEHRVCNHLQVILMEKWNIFDCDCDLIAISMLWRSSRKKQHAHTETH